jgi:CheY-like chemotaxis protein
MTYHILLVDDDKQLHELVEDALLPLDARLSAVVSAEEGLKIAINEQPNLILMDLLLPAPSMKGWEAIAALKSNPKTAHIHTLALTAASNETILKALQAGANDYITKPFSIAQFQSNILRIFGASKS